MIDNANIAEQRKLVEKYKKKYRTFTEDLDKSPLAKVMPNGVTESQQAGLLLKLAKYENYENWVLNEYGTLSDLGKMPTFARDVITINFGLDPTNVFAGNQELKSSHNLVYFKKTIATSTRGNVTTGDVLRDPRVAPTTLAIDYAGSGVSTPLATTVAGTLTYTGTLAKTPVRKGTIIVTVSNSITNFGQDNSLGNILGVNLYGTIDYPTGAISVTFTSDPGSGVIINVGYATNFEENGNYSRIQNLWDNLPVDAQVRALGMDVGVIQQYELQQMLGVNAEDDSVKTLSEEITVEQCQVLINQMYVKAVGLTQWNRRVPAGVASALHRISLDFAFEEANQLINFNAGRGVVNVILGGASFCTYIATLEDFVASNVSASGPHIFGSYKGKIVVKAPQLPTWKALFVYKGTDNFDVAAVNSTFMPLIIVKHAPVNSGNAFKNQNACAIYNALTVVNPNFITVFEIYDAAYP
jgi:hypothetical protein